MMMPIYGHILAIYIDYVDNYDDSIKILYINNGLSSNICRLNSSFKRYTNTLCICRIYLYIVLK